MTHLLVTNDFPPKIGGIQSYLWELWRRFPPTASVVLTTRHPESDAFDRSAPLRVERHGRVLLPTPKLARRIDHLADEVGATLVLLDPVVPLGGLARWLDHPYGVIVHGAELAVPARLPGYRHITREVLRGAELVIAAGVYPAAEARRVAGGVLSVVEVPPGVDAGRFVPLDVPGRSSVREHFGLDADARVVLSVSRLVPRKGMDVLIRAAGRLASGRPDLVVVIAGSGRDRARLERLASRHGSPVRFLGAVDDAQLAGLYAGADLFVLACRNRWGGLEQEGFGIVFLEASACGLPVVAGRSGGSHEAVLDGRTGIVLDRPRSPESLELAIAELLARPDWAAELGQAGRARCLTEFDEDRLAGIVLDALEDADARLGLGAVPGAM